MEEIEFTPENIMKCHCSQCKVQRGSGCVKDSMVLLQEKALGSGLVEPEEYPGLYCATSKSHCNDLNRNEKCMCIECSIWKVNDLESGLPTGYFCLNGRSTSCYLGERDIEKMERINDFIRDYYVRVD